jgi:hypothetical protein
MNCFQANGLPPESLSELTNVVMDAIGWEQGITKDPHNQSSASFEMECNSPQPVSPPPDHDHSFVSSITPQIVEPFSDNSKLQKKLLQLDIELRRSQIRESKARTAYYLAATKLLNEKRTAAASRSSSEHHQQSDSKFIVVDPSVLLE